MLSDILRKVKDKEATLVAVSKTKPIEEVLRVYDQGIRDFGENRVQELLSKYEALPKDIRWHMIGTLQKNKIKAIVPFIHLIHSVDSLDLLLAIDKEAAKIDRMVDVLLQFHIATEETKHGFDPDDIAGLIASLEAHPPSHVRIVGVMGMATFTEDQSQVATEFRSLRTTFETLKSSNFFDGERFKHVSMGMSGDYQIALDEGSTIVRIGSAIFGHR